MSFSRAALTLFLLFPALTCAQTTDKLTMLEGSLKLIRGTAVYKVDRTFQGMQLRQGDLFESSEGGFAQFEFAGGTIVALGPSSKVFLYRLSTGHKRGAAPGQPVANLILLSGWLKGESSATAGTFRYSNSLLSLASANGSILIHLDAEGCDAYVESGSATLDESPSEAVSKHTGAAKAGQFFSRKAGKNLTTLTRPSPSFVQSMPIPFNDTLPSLAAHYADKKPPEPKTDHTVTFADLQPWLALPSGWRKGFVERFAPLLSDHEFRDQMEARLTQYPEWDPVLHPEKYQPETAPPANNPEKPQ